MNSLDHPSFPNPSTLSNRSIALRFGAIWGASTIFFSLVAFLTDTDPSMPDTGGIKWLYAIVGFGISIWAVVAAIGADRQQLGGLITLGRCVGLGALVGTIAGVIGAAYTLLYVFVINPDFQENMNVAMQAEWEKQGMDEQQIEMAASMASMFTNPIVMIISQVLGGIISGVLIGLIAGAFMKREQPNA
ncbi:MAG: DUF4199 domain-containing protein [Saprospiraceae bacterium]|nr:DUF4199 domain-containing protein [Saprospiraceae bacterium]